MAIARGDCIYPGHDRSPVRAGANDVDWIPVVSTRGWVAVVRDQKIRTRPLEKAALAEHPLRMLVLTSSGQLNVCGQLRVLVARWDKIKELVQEPSPRIYAVTMKQARAIPYPEEDVI